MFGIIRKRIFFIGVSFCLGVATPLQSSVSSSSDYHKIQSVTSRACKPIITGGGAQQGQITQSLLTAGNINCVEAQYGGELRLDVKLCGGRAVALRGMTIERNAFANGRRSVSRPNVRYDITYADGTRSMPQPLGSGYRGHRTISFPAQQAVSVSIVVPSEPTRGDPVYEQFCSVTFDVAPQ